MAGKKILIVDADAASRNFVARNLMEQSYEVSQAGSGKEGLILAWRDRPDLLIIDPLLPDLKGEEIAAKLRQDVRTAKAPLIALSSDSSAARIKPCLDAGFNDYIAKSGQAMQVLNETIQRLLGHKIITKQGGYLIVFLSAKGGVGASSLCANLAMNIAHNRPEASVAVVDMVLPIGSIAPMVGGEGMTNLVTVTDKNVDETTSEFYRKHLSLLPFWRFYLLAGSPDPETSSHLKVGRIWEIVNTLQATYDYVVLDLGRSLSKFGLALIQHADLAVLTISADLSTIKVTKILLEYLKSKGLQDASFFTILNRAVGLEGLSKLEIEKILGLEIKAAMPYLGSNFALANNQRQPFALKFPGDLAAAVLSDAARRMVTDAQRSRAES